jgi:hypothetical protein
MSETAATVTPSNGATVPTQTAKTENTAPAVEATNTANASEAKPKQKLKIRDLELDEESAYREIQRARQTARLLSEAQRRAEVAEQKEKALAEKHGKYKQDLGSLFADLGIDDAAAADLAAQYIYQKQILPSEMTPEQRRVAELESKLAQYETEQKTFAEKQAEQQRMQVIQEESQKLQTELIEAAKTGKIPNTEYGMRKIAAKLLELEERGLSVPLEQVAAVVREESGREFGQIAASSDIADLREWLGDSNFKAFSKKVLDYFLGQVQSAKTATKPPPTGAASTTASQRMTPEEYLRRLEGRK